MTLSQTPPQQTTGPSVLLHTHWDWAGVDGLQLAIALFGPTPAHLSRFQSLAASFAGMSCSILRLCEGNFRVRFPEGIAFAAAIRADTAKLRVWVKPCERMGAIVLPEAPGLTRLPQIATTKPIYSLATIGPDRAVPARIDGIAVLIWRHNLDGQPVVEVQTAVRDLETIRARFGSAEGSRLRTED